MKETRQFLQNLLAGKQATIPFGLTPIHGIIRDRQTLCLLLEKRVKRRFGTMPVSLITGSMLVLLQWVAALSHIWYEVIPDIMVLQI